jgi:DNA (cytosine-5)-methyltransferase 1
MYIDLFAGCGGLSLGLQKAGWQGLFAVEKNNDAFTTLHENLMIRGNHFNWPNWLPVRNWDINELLNEYATELEGMRGNVTLVVGGPPCQGFSMAGKRTGKDARNRFYNAYVNFVELVQPQMLFFENVHGFTMGFKRKYRGKETKGEAYSEKLIKALKRLGYQVAHDVVLVSEYGVPQKRKRFILFATRNGNPKDFFVSLKNNRELFFKNKGLSIPINIQDAIGDLQRKYGEVPSPDSNNFMNGKYGPILSEFQQLMRTNVPEGAIPNSHRFAHQSKDTIKLLEHLMEATDGAIRITPKMNLVEGLKKRGVTPLKANCICPTITSIPDDFIHFSEPRIMTVRECARIQSFPDDFLFQGRYTTGGERRKVEIPRYTQVANAVPPLFAEQVGLALRGMI